MPARCKLLTFALLLFLAGSAGAVPVRVLSRTALEIDVQKRWDQLQVTGSLHDDSGAPISMAEVALSLPGWGDNTALTDAAGRFAFTLMGAEFELLAAAVVKASPDGAAPEVNVLVRFGGDSNRGETEANQTIDLSRETLHLQAAVTPSRLSRGDVPRVLAVLRHGTEPAPDLPIDVVIGEQKRRMYTGPDGRVVFESFDPPEAGRYSVSIQFEGSERFNATGVEREISVTVHTRVTLERVDDGSDPLSIVIRGQLTSGDGEGKLGLGLPGKVTLALNDLAYAYVDAGENGEFEARVDLTDAATRFGPAPGLLRAVYSPREAWEVGAISPSLELLIPAPPRVPLPFYVVPLLLLAGIGFVLVVVRSGRLRGAWTLVAERFRPAFMRRGSAADGRSALLEAAPARPPGVSAPRRDVAGWAWNALTDLALTGCELQVLGADGTVVARTSSANDGSFIVAGLPDGRFQLSLTRPGFVPTSLPLNIPHRGVFSQCRVRLTPLRALTAAAYSALVDELSLGEQRFGTGTPREVREALLAVVDNRAALDELTRAFEAHYFGGSHRVTLAQHEAVLALVEQLRSRAA